MFFSPAVALITEDDCKLASLAGMSILQFFLQDVSQNHDSAKHCVQIEYLITSSKMSKEITCKILKSRLSNVTFQKYLVSSSPFPFVFLHLLVWHINIITKCTETV